MFIDSERLYDSIRFMNIIVNEQVRMKELNSHQTINVAFANVKGS
jgi:hypothetical protein